MALPQVNTPTYELAVPSTDKKLKYRPFLVKEEKILMIAMEAEKQSGIIDAVKEIVKSCTFEKFDISLVFLLIGFNKESILSNTHFCNLFEILSLS